MLAWKVEITGGDKMKNCTKEVICLYKEKGRKKIKPEFLPVEIYSAAMKSFVVVCTDAIIISKKEKAVYLAKRKIKPMKDWWVIGGRSFAGELPKVSIARCFERETTLKLSKRRFKLLCINRYLWKDREQEPQDAGSDNLAYTFAVELSGKERVDVSANLNNEEYEDIGLEKFDLGRLCREKAHPMIIAAYKQIFKSCRKRNSR